MAARGTHSLYGVCTMSETTTATATVSTPEYDAKYQAFDAEAATQGTLSVAALCEGLDRVPLYSTATATVQGLLLADAVQCVNGDGLALGEYLEGLADWGGTAAEYLAENGVEVPSEDTTTEPAVNANATPASPAPALPAPTATLAQCNKDLDRYGRVCAKAADTNYAKAAVAAQYVAHFLGHAPTLARRSTAVDNLAAEEYKWDPEAVAKNRERYLTTLRERVNTLLQCQAVVELLGDGSAHTAPNAKGVSPRLPWGTLCKFKPLVYRPDPTEYSNTWALLPSVAEEARKLFAEVAAKGQSRDDTDAAVTLLRLVDANMELEAAKRSGDAKRITQAENAVATLGGKVERQEAKANPTPATTPATPETPASVKAPEPTPEPEAAPIPQPSVESRQGENLLRRAVAPDGQPQTPRALAESIAELFRDAIGCPDPDTTLAITLELLADCKALSPKFRELLMPVVFAMDEELADDEPQEQDSKSQAQDAAAYLRGEQPAGVKMPA